MNLLKQLSDALEQLVAKAAPAVLGIEHRRGHGTAWVLAPDGYLVTNAHVVRGAAKVRVQLAEEETRSAEVVGVDARTDVAVVRVDARDLPTLALADRRPLKVGQLVLAIGNPFRFDRSVSLGVVSALDRSLPTPEGGLIEGLVQTDAAINPGNSGGPLLNLSGEVIGVNAQIQTGGQSQANSGVGFAIPVSIVQLVVPDLIKTGTHNWTWIGISSDPRGLSPLTVQAMNLPVNKGVYIIQVQPNGPADQAGLRGSTGTKSVNGRDVEVGGDVITAIDGQPVNTFSDLLVYLAMNTQPGQKVTLTIVRDGKSQEVPVTLQKRPENLTDFATP